MPHTKTASQRLRDLRDLLANQYDIDCGPEYDLFEPIIKQVEFLEKSVEREVERLGLKPHDDTTK